MTFSTPLLPHQQRAVDRLRKLRVGALYIEKGCGKARTVLELAHLRICAGKIDRVLWLCPCDALHRLRQKIRSLTDRSDYFLLHGVESLSHSLHLTLQLRDLAASQRIMLVVDGGDLVKNPASLRTMRVTMLAQLCPYRLLVSEVPLTRSIEDMYSQWYLLDWRILGYQSYWSFSINHLDVENSAPARRVPQNVEYLLRRIEPYTCQVLRSDCQLLCEGAEYIWQFRLSPEVMTYYREVVRHMLQRIHGGGADLYRLLLICQQMSSGRALSRLHPLTTAPMYAHPLDNPRIRALLDVVSRLPEQPTLILCRFTYEVMDVLNALRAVYGADCCRAYVRSTRRRDAVRFLVMNRLCAAPLHEEECSARLIIHYSHDWDWGKRRKSELHAPDLPRSFVSLVAVNTIDVQILQCLLHKQNLVRMIQKGLTNGE